MRRLEKNLKKGYHSLKKKKVAINGITTLLWFMVYDLFYSILFPLVFKNASRYIDKNYFKVIL